MLRNKRKSEYIFSIFLASTFGLSAMAHPTLSSPPLPFPPGTTDSKAKSKPEQKPDHQEDSVPVTRPVRSIGSPTIINTPPNGANPSPFRVTPAMPPFEHLNDRNEQVRRHMEELRRLQEERSARRRRDNEAAFARALDAAKERYEQSKSLKESEPIVYLESCINLAAAYFSVADWTNGDPVFKEALNIFLSKKIVDLKSGTVSKLWSALPEASHADFQTYFPQILRITESGMTQPEDVHYVNNYVASALERRGRSDLSESDRRRFWMTALELRSEVRGMNDFSLRPWLLKYAALCDGSGNVNEAEKSYVRLLSLPVDGQNPDASLNENLQVIKFYQRHSMFDKIDAALDDFAKNIVEVSKRFPDHNLYSTLQTCFTIYGPDDAEKFTERLLSVGTDNLVSSLDSEVQKLVAGYIESGNLQKAEALTSLRVKTSQNLAHDVSANDWKLKLSEIYLAMNRDVESRKLFDEVRRTTALQEGDVNFLLQKRATMLRRMGDIDEAKTLEEQLPKRLASTTVQIPFGLFSRHGMVLGNNVTVSFYDSGQGAAPTAQSGSGEIRTLGTLTREGSINMQGTVMYKEMQFNLDETNHKIGEPVPLSPGSDFQPQFKQLSSDAPNVVHRKSSQKQPSKRSNSAEIPPALSAPSTTQNCDKSQASALMPGDYFVSDDTRARPDWRSRGRIRLFLMDSPKTPPIIMLPYNQNRTGRPADLQVWYNGNRQIQVSHRSSGLIYAPGATVELPLGAEFNGAIVADHIVVRGNNKINIDVSLLNHVFKAED